MTLDVSEPESIRDLILILDTFRKVTGLEINWLKSHAYWLSHSAKPLWLENIGWQWAQEKDLVKLLGTPFGIDPSSESIDQFLIARVTKKTLLLDCSEALPRWPGPYCETGTFVFSLVFRIRLARYRQSFGEDQESSPQLPLVRSGIHCESQG